MLPFYDMPPLGNGVHGAAFGLKLQEKLRGKGVFCEVARLGKNPVCEMNQIRFIIEQLSPFLE
jgi:hypothetical protein